MGHNSEQKPQFEHCLYGEFNGHCSFESNCFQFFNVIYQSFLQENLSVKKRASVNHRQQYL